MRVLITGGAGYIGPLLTGVLLLKGYQVTIVDDLQFGGDSLLTYMTHPGFRFYKGNVTEKGSIKKYFEDVDHIVHLAAIVGFPACQQIGPELSWQKRASGSWPMRFRPSSSMIPAPS